MASEKQTYLTKLWVSKGYTVINLIRTNCNGISDLIAFKDGETVFIESKEPKDHLKPLQRFRAKEFTRNGFKVFINEIPFKDYKE